MNEKITLTNNGVDTVYVREDLATKNTGVGLFREVKFCGFDWNVIAEDSESLTLLMKKCLSPDIIKKVFNSDEYDSDYDVKFNSDSSDWRWKNSIIRKRLNDRFLKMLDKDSLVPMTSTVWLDGESSTTKDYVRLLSVEELFRLPKSLKENKCKYLFWSFSPHNLNSVGYASVFSVNSSGNLDYYLVDSSGAVAPVIKLKRSSLTEK